MLSNFTFVDREKQEASSLTLGVLQPFHTFHRLPSVGLESPQPDYTAGPAVKRGRSGRFGSSHPRSRSRNIPI